MEPSLVQQYERELQDAAQTSLPDDNDDDEL